MNAEEIKQAYYKLALAEIQLKANSQVRGKPLNTAKWLKLAELICLQDYTLYGATLELGLARGSVLKQGFRFIRCRPAVETRQGNRELKSYSRAEKLKVLRKLAKHSYAEVQKMTGVSYPTLQKWKLQKAAGVLK